MNAKNLIAVVAATAAVAAGSAFADDSSAYVDQSRVTGTKTRAEVRAELEREYNAGRYLSVRQPEFVEFTQVVSSRERDQARAEAAQAAKPAAATSSGN
jgi:hypothetical protein